MYVAAKTFRTLRVGLVVVLQPNRPLACILPTLFSFSYLKGAFCEKPRVGGGRNGKMSGNPAPDAIPEARSDDKDTRRRSSRPPKRRVLDPPSPESVTKRHKSVAGPKGKRQQADSVVAGRRQNAPNPERGNKKAPTALAVVAEEELVEDIFEDLKRSRCAGLH